MIFFLNCQMKCVVILLIAAHAILCSGTAQPSPYSPYYGYGVPVASQPIVYGGSAVTTAGPYVGSYAVHSPAVSHSYSTHTQTHPVSYVRPVSIFISIKFEENIFSQKVLCFVAKRRFEIQKLKR